MAPEALAVLLQTWNKAFYRFHKFDERHFSEIEKLVDVKLPLLLQFGKRSIDDFEKTDEPLVEELFRDVELVLGPVGAAKSIHLLAPQFFPLWDRAIAKAYKISLKKTGKNAAGYVEFMWRMKEQVERLKKQIKHGEKVAIENNLLKAIDEFNYCTYTLPKEKHSNDKAAEKRRNANP